MDTIITQRVINMGEMQIKVQVIGGMSNIGRALVADGIMDTLRGGIINPSPQGNQACSQINGEPCQEWLWQQKEYHKTINEVKTELAKLRSLLAQVELVAQECLINWEYQGCYIAFLLGQYTEEEFKEVASQFATPLGDAPPKDPFDELKSLLPLLMEVTEKEK